MVDCGTGFPIVLLHGSPTSSFVFRHQIGALRERFRVIAPDLPGFGRSEAPPGGVGFQQQAAVLRDLLDSFELDEYGLVGHDWGGPIGVACATRRPEQLRRLVLLNTTLRPDFKPPWYWGVYTAPLLGDLLLVRLNVFGRGLPLLMRAARDRRVHARYLEPTRRAGTRRTLLALERLAGYRALMGQAVQAFPRMRAPTLILWGLPDVYFRRREARRLREMLPWAQLRTLPGGGHFPQEDTPEVVTEALLGFFGEGAL